MPRSSGFWLLFGAVAALGCRAPTQVTLEISTEADCAAIEQHHVDVKVGETGSLGEAATTSTNKCDAAQTPHRIGSLVVVPREENDAEFGVMVVAGVTRHVSTCEQFHYDGCIVARRTARFIPHTPQTLPIILTTDCIGVPCASGETCQNGACVPVNFTPPPACMNPDGCGGAGQTGGAGGTGNMGGAGTTTSTGMGGAGSGTGGGGGAGGGGPTGPVIPCGGELCQPGQVCCHNTLNSFFDKCDNPGCDLPYVEIRCAGPGDCMPGQVCCGAWSYGINNWVSAECKPQCNNENPFCGDAPDSCPPGWTCNTPDNLLGSGYGWCSPP